jgi:PPOX class probable F420-dependent enzyme
MALDMTPEERRAFLLEGTRTGKLAVPRANGAPHVVPIWFVLDGDDIIFTTADSNVKGKSIVRDGRAAVCVDDQAPPYSFVLVEGIAAWSDDLDEMLPWATKIGARYMGGDRAEEFGRRNAVPGEILVRLRPARIVAKAGMSD